MVYSWGVWIVNENFILEQGKQMHALKERAQFLRRNQTDAEKLLWQRLRGRNLLGKKFYRQFVIAPYIVDFICRELKLIVELDGGQHMDNRELDIARTRYLETQGYQVIRFWNNQVFEEMEGVLTALTLALSQREKEQKSISIKCQR